MEKSKILLIDMHGVIIKESKGYFVPYTLQRFGASEHGRIKRIIKEEQAFTKAQKRELSSTEELGIQTILFNRDGVEYDGRVVDDFEALGEMLNVCEMVLRREL